MLPVTLPAPTLTVLCIGAHPDDIEIGCGGTILALAAARDVSPVHLVLTGSPERQAEARRAAGLFWQGGQHEPEVFNYEFADGRLPASWNEVKQVLEDVGQRIHPDLVLAPRPDDAHQDHRLLAKLVPTVWRDSLVLHYEVPKWDGDMFPVTTFVPMGRDIAVRKVELLDEVFPSQRAHDWWDEEVFLGLMRLRGMECRERYAEGFTADRILLAP